ncbi:MAG: oxidoreductase [Ignavibacteria bacterium RIFOXYB2_FULL_35_12]|nr:MAG: oxidoreductase [Ignavibacteria bacterium GWF2_35_20]OGU88437.1 MAG: oxidoreductase [Ignavibacteria bacterium RIFOXYA12_FULL_35_25]OGU92476.1 MAG: oxidoreductase [Ignavibacteria bacterium RIFOXYC12_FULL_35_11]OGU95853.1 MAG: oxidoreductase [Ignavibacteria bacterium RIFOXYB12_FULL_35_14]OGV00908.1 MAG: oxidoreductase [Ignavibacteria bacterium RIFOXYC2_FULL_35_16]OGV05401.1 MAG: oxidoreductase [Ignavibacteria bacterium RIFOXYB2_FULL_35_12]OGV33401.1 MAG: oxidoreductase [Ignavibacteria ba
MKKFAITGVAGYIAPRHLRAIKDTGNILVAAADPHDSVGILDQYFPDAAFFTEIERFDRHLDKLRRSGKGIDYLSICSPNNLHDAHIRLALRNDAHAICEKPLVLNPWNLDLLEKLEEEYKRKIFSILQLRVHPSLISLKDKIEKERKTSKHKVELTYVTSRGKWYDYSWKGDPQKSGGIATNIGIHFFDLLIWLFGKPINYNILLNRTDKMKGELELESADVSWFLSIDKKDLAGDLIRGGKTTYRSIKIDDKEIEFTEGFTELHTEVYRRTLNGNGFTISDARPSIEFVQKLRSGIFT